ncbi:MAG: 2-oxoglutarate dehydrogenase, E2 component, dihydrolipoamide succinyltransferase [Bacteroidetes bacterium]|jgi:2-oxoglutarate dehydrogenase E2 component (dihydrolipoamide succinyltransferase)|nr:2-oxoglutarate dehydrogenase, E2 component, dihydrolipoamide succinyltransferase [Bacteroidota bacterium]
MAKVEVTMPKMGESITEGTIIAWHKTPGDSVEQDETLLEIGTDKVDTEVPSPAEGVLLEQLVEEGDTVDVGTVIATLETEAEEADEASAAGPPDEAAEETAAEEGATEERADEEPAPAAAPASAGEAAAPTAQESEVATAEAEEPAPSEPTASGGGEEIEVVMPKMGESITEGTIIAWYKEPGDPIDLDETLLEIGTDKVDTEVPSPAQGVLKERLVEEGDTVEVGTKIAIIGAEAEAGGAEPPEDTAPSAEPAAEEPAEPASERTTPAPSGDGAVTEPANGQHEISRKGDDGRFYSPLVRSIAEKEGLSMQELESIDGSGRGGRVTKEDVMAYLEQRDEAPAEDEAAPAERETQPEPSAREAPTQPAPERPTRPAYTVEAGPSASELEDKYEGRIEVMEMDRMRQITAEHMVRSKATSAHVTSFAEADVTGLVKFRERHKEAFQEQEGVKLTFTPFFVKAAVEALREHPVLNASVEGDKIVMKKYFNIGIAVAIGKKGLLAPVIRNAGDKNIIGLARAAADLADRARNKALQPDELQGGTFTVTNIGSLGSLMGTPIINQPQVGILATGTIKKRPVVIEDPELGDIIAVRHIMYLSLSYDHRVIDGAMGASYLQSYVDALEAYSGDMDLMDV